MVGGPGEKSDSFARVQLGRGTGAVVESLSIYLPDLDDERGFFAHMVRCKDKVKLTF